MDQLDIFKGARVLVTGSTGFKGSWLCIWLKSLGADVFGYALPAEHSNDNFEICDMDSEIINVYGDIRFSDSIETYIHDIQPEFIFHLAAQPIVLRSYDDPLGTIGTNVMGTVNLLEAARTLDCLRSIVVVTSDKCYENTGEILRENDKLGGADPYSASKACQDIISTSYYKSFFHNKKVGLATVRAGNVIGGGDRGEHRIVADCINAIECGDNIEIRNPMHTRPWQYVLEPIYGYLRLAALMASDTPYAYSHAWNFGPEVGTCTPVVDLAKKILQQVKAMGIDTVTEIVISQTEKAHESPRLSIDSTKSKELLGVKNVLCIDDICKFVVEDYFCEKDFLEQRMNRIEMYEELIGNEV